MNSHINQINSILLLLVFTIVMALPLDTFALEGDQDVVSPRPCFRSVEYPDKGCLVTFTQHLSSLNCLIPRASLFVRNDNTHRSFYPKITLTQLFCPRYGEPLEYKSHFFIAEPSSVANMYFYFENQDPGSGNSFHHTVVGPIAIVEPTVKITQAPQDCVIQPGETTCNSRISWNNLNYAPGAGLYYRPVGGHDIEDEDSWTLIDKVETSSGSLDIPIQLSDDVIEVAIFQYSENMKYAHSPIGSALLAPSGKMAGPFLVEGIDNYQPLAPQWGHSGFWYEPATAGQGFTFEVNPINEVVTAEWFTYADDGKGRRNPSYNRWYLQTGSYNPDNSNQNEVYLDIFRVTGGRFNNPDKVSEKKVGTAKISFFACDTTYLEYDFDSGYNNNREGDFLLTRILPNIDCLIDEYTGPHKSDFGYTGNWYDPSTSGQGFFFEVNPQAGLIAGAWYTYLPTYSSNMNKPNRQRWFNLVGTYTPGGSQSNTMTIYQYTKGALDDPYPVKEEAVGTAIVEFTSCSTASITYKFTGAKEFAGLEGTIDLVRIASNVTCQ